MEGKKNNFVGDIYTSYGPFVGKVCENTNVQLQQDNIIESITNSVTNSPIVPVHTSPIEKVMEKTLTNNIQDMKIAPTEPTVPIIKTSSGAKINKKIKFGGETNINTNKQIINESNIIEKNNLVNEETSSFFNYKVSIYSYKISIWILLLVLLIILCIGYFIYKYWYLKNTSIISYQKNKMKTIESNNDDLNSNSSENTTSNTRDNSTTSSKSYESSKSSKN